MVRLLTHCLNVGYLLVHVVFLPGKLLLCPRHTHTELLNLQNNPVFLQWVSVCVYGKGGVTPFQGQGVCRGGDLNLEVRGGISSWREDKLEQTSEHAFPNSVVYQIEVCQKIQIQTCSSMSPPPQCSPSNPTQLVSIQPPSHQCSQSTLTSSTCSLSKAKHPPSLSREEHEYLYEQ
jgi:hypothetical protein